MPNKKQKRRIVAKDHDETDMEEEEQQQNAPVASQSTELLNLYEEIKCDVRKSTGLAYRRPVEEWEVTDLL